MLKPYQKGDCRVKDYFFFGGGGVTLKKEVFYCDQNLQERRPQLLPSAPFDGYNLHVKPLLSSEKGYVTYCCSSTVLHRCMLLLCICTSSLSDRPGSGTAALELAREGTAGLKTFFCTFLMCPQFSCWNWPKWSHRTVPRLWSFWWFITANWTQLGSGASFLGIQTLASAVPAQERKIALCKSDNNKEPFPDISVLSVHPSW